MRTVIMAVIGLMALSGFSAEAIWWEAEDAAAMSFPKPEVEGDKGPEVLSGGKWVGAWPGWTRTHAAEYDVNVPEDGTWDLYARKFWKHGPYRWRFDDQPWQEVTKDVALLDSEMIRVHTPANWTYAGRAELKKGKHRLRIELTDNESVALFDCFVLTQEPFFPRGKFKPGEPYPPAPEGWFNFNQYETVLDDSPIDMRVLNEQEAGADGFIRVKGEQFMQNGKPIRFLACNTGHAIMDMPKHLIDIHARFLARKGVNLVRLHGAVCVREGPNAGEVDREGLDQMFYYIAALKREGIFSHLSIYFQHWFDASEVEALPGYAPEQKPFAIHFYNEEWQKMYRDWWRAIFTTENPYTGKALKDDACIMGAELLNEDSFFFWTFDYKNIPGPQMRMLEKMFGDWLIKKYGSLEAALTKWDLTIDQDMLGEGRVGFVPVWQMFNQRDLRSQDTVKFLAEVQRKFFDDHYRFLRREIGFKGVICASNWRTANTRFLGALDKWTNAGCDFFDSHGYYASWRKKVTEGYGFGVGDLVADRSLARWDTANPDRPAPKLEVPFMASVIAGQPAMVSEYAWPNFNRWRGEMPLISLSLAAQAGLDAMVTFSLVATPAWQGTLDATHWPLLSPCELGQFPAAALTYRQGMVAESDPVAVVNINVDDMMALKGNAFTDPSSGDYNRAEEGRDTSEQGVDIRYFAAGKVSVNYVPTEGSFEKKNLSEYVDEEQQVLNGANGQIRWEYGKGLFLLRAPKAQAVTGFLGDAGEIKLPELTVKSDLPFGTVWAVAMDDRPLSQSRKILLQVMSEEQNRDYRTEGISRKKILDLGGPPIQVRKLSGTVRFTRKDASSLRVTALDVNGVPVGPAGTADHIPLQPTVIYYLLEK